MSRPAARSHSFWIIGSRARACEPDNSTRPCDCSYLSSIETVWIAKRLPEPDVSAPVSLRGRSPRDESEGHARTEDDDVGLQIAALAILSHRFPRKHGRTDHPGPDQIGVMFSGPQYARMLFNVPESANWKTVMQLTRFEPTLAR